MKQEGDCWLAYGGPWCGSECVPFNREIYSITFLCILQASHLCYLKIPQVLLAFNTLPLLPAFSLRPRVDDVVRDLCQVVRDSRAR